MQHETCTAFSTFDRCESNVLSIEVGVFLVVVLSPKNQLLLLNWNLFINIIHKFSERLYRSLTFILVFFSQGQRSKLAGRVSLHLPSRPRLHQRHHFLGRWVLRKPPDDRDGVGKTGVTSHVPHRVIQSLWAVGRGKRPVSFSSGGQGGEALPRMWHCARRHKAE